MAKTVLHTPLCDLLGIEYPVLLAGMGPVAGGIMGPVATRELAAAVSNAGGLGIIGGVAYGPEELRAEIRALRELTDRPFGVDLLFAENLMRPVRGDERLPGRELLPAETRDALLRIAADLGVEWKEDPNPPRRPAIPAGKSYVGAQMEIVLEEKVPVLASGLGSPGPWVEELHANGAKVIALVGNVRGARRVAKDGVDIVVAQGTEAGGHTGRIATLALVPQVADAVAPIPVVAAGGIADGRALAAVLALGAIGAWCGTAFLVAEEANQPPLQKQRILDAAAEDTVVTRLYSGKTMRNITNPLIEAWEASGIQALPMGLQGVLTRDLLYSIRQAGREDLLMNAAGQTAGMLHRVRPASEILEEMIGQAAFVLARQLPQHVTASVGAAAGAHTRA
ncbi:MAG TPA: nitronate monooxygenase [Thermoanaerobaculia bacterium]|nr:nitronate monooxygenase [Thermoanaerobaculia bacterium]